MVVDAAEATIVRPSPAFPTAGPIPQVPPIPQVAVRLTDAADWLFDPGTARPLAPSAEWHSTGAVDGQRAVLFGVSTDHRHGSLAWPGCEAVVAACERALDDQCPVVGLWQQAGHYPTEGTRPHSTDATRRHPADMMRGLHGTGAAFAAMARASGQVPQIAVVFGSALSGPACGPALADLVIVCPGDQACRTGVAHLRATDVRAAFDAARCLVALLGAQGAVDPARTTPRPFTDLLPASARRAYDVRRLIDQLTDEPAVELHAAWAPSIVTALGRLGGGTVGVLANNPLRMGGCLTSAAAEKAARFVRMCDCFGVPLVVLVDVPGYLPGLAQEWEGIVRRGAKLLYAFAEAVVPRVTVVTRKAYGGAYIAMNSRALGATRVFAWPDAEVAVMGAVSAVRILHRRELAATPPERRAQAESELAARHEREASGIERALGMGVVDEVIHPYHTRAKVAQAIATAPGQRGRHANIPL